MAFFVDVWNPRASVKCNLAPKRQRCTYLVSHGPWLSPSIKCSEKRLQALALQEIPADHRDAGLGITTWKIVVPTSTPTWRHRKLLWKKIIAGHLGTEWHRCHSETINASLTILIDPFKMGLPLSSMQCHTPPIWIDSFNSPQLESHWGWWILLLYCWTTTHGVVHGVVYHPPSRGGFMRWYTRYKRWWSIG